MKDFHLVAHGRGSTIRWNTIARFAACSVMAFGLVLNLSGEVAAQSKSTDELKQAEQTLKLADKMLESKDFEGAIKSGLAVLGVQRAALGEKHVRVGRTLMLVGYYYHLKSHAKAGDDSRKAMEYYQEALSLFEALPEDRDDAKNGKNGSRNLCLADIHHHIGSWHRHQDALTIAAKNYCLAIDCSIAAKRFDRANDTLDDLLGVCESLKKKRVPAHAESLNQNIDFLKDRFDAVGVQWTRSKKDLDRFASLMSETGHLPGTPMQTGGAEKSDGLRERLQEVNRQFDAGNYAKVRPELEKLLQDIKASKGAATTSVPSIKTRLSLCDLFLAGRAFSSSGNFEGACAEHYESSKRLVMEAMTEVQERAAWAALAQTHAERIESLGQARECFNALLSHYALPMQLSQLVNDSLDPRLRAVLPKPLKEILDHPETKLKLQSINEIYELVLNWKGLALVTERNWSRRIHANLGDKGLVQLRSAYGRLLLNPNDRTAIADLNGLALRSTETSTVIPRASLSELQRSLNKDDVLLDLYEFNAFRPEISSEEVGKAILQIFQKQVVQSPKVKIIRQKELVVFVVKPASLDVVWIGPTTEIDRNVNAWLELVKTSERATDLDAPSKVIKQLFWDKIAKELTPTSNVLIAADGRLALFPIGALPVTNAKFGKYLIQERSLQMVPFPRLLSESAHEPAKSLVAVDVLEAESVRSIVTDAYGEISPHPVNWIPVNKGGRVSKEDIIANSSQPGFAVFASHGISHRGSLGILLDNRKVKTDKQDDNDVLMPYDIARLDGSRGDFVFLMLCNGAQGNVVDGEWILGPQRAFLVSGYRSTIGTLWPIEENAGRYFLRNFLTNRWHGDGMSKQDALRNVQLSLLGKANSAHPRHWASWILSGSCAE